ncbi:hypothetical protein Glove_519g63 [Diversispora epigaea]|uniref:MULE transposase domain-containing protein n=1 Tax=Diversispora epigaea TaxID=1348612 RepID=A0A397GIM2_9GLOM|nr:hypothetical protein Glove_519g63 [Diversispora epigaea]
MSELNYLFHDDYNIELDNNELNNNELDNNELESFFHDDQYFYAITSQIPPNKTNSTLTVDHENLFCDDHYIFASASLQVSPHEMNDIESDESDDLSNFLELISGLTTSETDKGVLRRATYEYTKSSSYNPQVISDPTKRRNVHSQRTQSPRFWKLSNEMLADIEKYVVQGRMDSGSIYPLLRHDYPGNTDASQMLQQLLEWKDLESLWIVKPRLEPVSRKLKSLFWMSLKQRELYDKFNDVVIMLLCIVAVVDNNYRTRIIASVIIEDEMLDTYRWIFENIFTETGISPGVVFTDSDPAFIRSIIDTFSNVQHLSCIFHIDLNLRKKLKRKLGSQFEEFRQKFYTCRNSLCKDLFEQSWVISWIHKHFTAGIQSSQRVESINKNIHDKVDRSISLCNLLNSIKDFVKNEEHLERFEIERNALPVVGMPMLNTRFFGQIDILIKEYLTLVMFGKQRSQMNQSVCYDVFRITEWQHLLVEIDNEEIDVGIREQEQNIQQILFSSLVRTIPQEAILEV